MRRQLAAGEQQPGEVGRLEPRAEVAADQHAGEPLVGARACEQRRRAACRARSRTRPGPRTAPESVTSADPGSSGVPISRNQRAPWRAISARWASVSTFWTSVGRWLTPRSNGRAAERRRGQAGVDEVDQRALLPGEVPLRGQDEATAVARRAGRAPVRSPIARSRLRMLRSSVSGTAMIASRAPTARAANASAVEHQVRQLAQQRRGPSCSRARPRRRWRARPCDRAATPTARSLSATGNEAPPWPRSPADATVSISWLGA